MHTVQHAPRIEKPETESIHSGQFMVSHFEAEEQDDEDSVAVPVPEVIGDIKSEVPAKKYAGMIEYVKNKDNQQLAIETSLSKLFECMSLAYRQKLTSPKWNRFRGIRLRWKDKIRLNNVIWRCWHLQFIRKENTLICQFASPLDVDTHNKPEAVVLEGKYWKRKLAAVTAEYKKWRMFYRNHALGHAAKDNMEMLNDVDLFVWDSTASENMMVDEDYMGLMSDTLFSTISNQPFVFPDSREIAKAGLADFIQPSLGPLQPNLDDYMDTIDPFHEFMSTKLPPVPEEQTDQMYKSGNWNYIDNSQSSVSSITTQPQIVQYQQLQPIQHIPMNKPTAQQLQDNRQNMVQTNYGDIILPPQAEPYLAQDPPPYHSTVISKTQNKVPMKNASTGKLDSAHINSSVYSKSVDTLYRTYQQQPIPQHSVMVNNRIELPQTESQQSSTSHMQDLPHYKLSPQSQIKQEQHFIIPQSTQEARQQSNQGGYKFPAPTSTPNIKFTSQQVSSHLHLQGGGFVPHSSHYQPTSPNSSSSLIMSDLKVEPKRRGAPRGRQRSRSNTREPIKKHPLISAVSDPQLINPTNSVLLTQLLATRDPVNHVYNRSQSSGSIQEISSQVRVKEEKTTIPILPQAPTNALIIQSSLSLNPVQQPLSVDPISLNSFSNSNSPIMDTVSQNLNSPTSSQGSMGSPNRDSHRDRRAGHIHAEQKRRYNIKNGFDMLHSLIPYLNENPNSKLSKAAMLQKGAEYIRQLRSERVQLKDEMDSLRQQIESLNTSISNCQSMLPATGTPISRRRDSKIQEMFEDHVRTRTMENWKYWIFSLIFRPLLNTFNNIVATSSLDDLYTSTMIWVEQHCTLVDLRPVVLNSLTNMCTITDVLTEPEKLPEEARQMVQRHHSKNQ